MSPVAHHVLARLRGIILSSDVAPVEFGLGMLNAVLGFWLFLPMDTFEDFLVYEWLLRIGPEPLWGLVLFLVGAFQLGALLNCGPNSFNGSQQPSDSDRRWRKWGTLACVAIWIAMLMGVVAARWQGLATGIYLVIALISIWAYLRLARVLA